MGRTQGRGLWCSHIKELLNKINSIGTTKGSHTLYNESILSCKIDLYRRFFVKSIDIIGNGCYSTNRTKSVEEDTAMAVSSINMMRSE